MWAPCSRGAEVCLERAPVSRQKIILNIFWRGGLMRASRTKYRRETMAERKNSNAFTSAPTRRELIRGITAALGGAALGPTKLWAETQEERSRFLEDIFLGVSLSLCLTRGSCRRGEWAVGSRASIRLRGLSWWNRDRKPKLCSTTRDFPRAMVST